MEFFGLFRSVLLCHQQCYSTLFAERPHFLHWWHTCLWKVILPFLLIFSLIIRFYDDFGPFNLAQVYRYCRKVNRKLKASASSASKIVHCTSTEITKRTNAAFLCGCYQIIYLNRTADESYKLLLSDKYRNFASYRWVWWMIALKFKIF